MRLLPLLAALGTLPVLSGQALATNLILNGGFEADAATIQSPDAITAWQSAEQGILGGVQVSNGTGSIVSGAQTVGAASGNNYALLDTAGLAHLAISQSFVVGQTLQSAKLSFSWFANYGGSQPAAIGQAFGLDHTSGGNYDANVQIRVDILRAGAGAFSTQAADVVWTQSAASLGAGPNAYEKFEATLDPALLQTGQAYTVRFAAVSNDGALVAGLDDVALNVTAVPEPGTWALMAAGLTLAAMRRRNAGKR